MNLCLFCCFRFIYYKAFLFSFLFIWFFLPLIFLYTCYNRIDANVRECVFYFSFRFHSWKTFFSSIHFVPFNIHMKNECACFLVSCFLVFIKHTPTKINHPSEQQLYKKRINFSLLKRTQIVLTLEKKNRFVFGVFEEMHLF